MKLYFDIALKNKLKYFSAAVVVLSRVVQNNTHAKMVNIPYINELDNFFGIVFFSNVLPFFYLLWILDGTRAARDEEIVLRRKGREGVAAVQCGHIVLDALTFTLLVQITGLPLVFLNYPAALKYLTFYLAQIPLEFLFFTVLSLLYTAVYLLTSRSFIAALLMLIYCSYDYLTAILSMNNVFLIGTSRAMFDEWSYFLPNLGFLAAVVIVGAVLCFFIFQKKDYLSRNEAQHE